jgi:phage N-6-adenine-methyltransferase
MDTRISERQTVNAGASAKAAGKFKSVKLNRGMFTSASDEWETPQKFFDAVNAIFHCTLDVCATPSNAKCARYYTKKEDGLLRPWRGICWMNPPYGREISRWIQKAYESSLEPGTVVVCLLPARTDTKWWHDHVMPRASIVGFIQGRLRFSGRGLNVSKGGAPFPSVLVVFGGLNLETREDFIAEHPAAEEGK